MTSRKAFYKKLKVGKAGYLNLVFLVNPYYEPLAWFMIVIILNYVLIINVRLSSQVYLAALKTFDCIIKYDVT